MPPTRTYHQRSFAPFPITYSSESFAPLVWEDRQIAHVRYLLRGQHAVLARFRHYLTDCSMIFALEQTLQELRDNHDYVFADFTTPDIVYRLQPFLIQSRRRSLAPVSIATTTTVTSTNSTYSRSSTRRPQEHAPTVRLPQTHHDNAPIHMPSPSLLPLSLVPPHRFQPPAIASFDMFPPSLLGSTLAAVVVPLTTISLGAPTEVGVFRANRGVVLRFSCSFCFRMVCLIVFFFYCDILFYLCFFCCGTFTFDLTSYCLWTSHLVTHWSDSFHDSLDKSSVTIVNH